MDKETITRFLLKVQEIKEKDRKRELEFGKIKPILHADVKGYKCVAVGSEVFFSKEWRTFPDFLMAYIWQVLGEEWAQSEISKPFAERHQILKWYDWVLRFHVEQKVNDNGLCFVVPNGVFYTFLLLAYDLYLIRHHLALQKFVVARLKDANQFQGARYELYATATCIRAGFEIQFEDEQSRVSKHVEFSAIHKASGQKIAVEAKSKHRKGVLGYQTDNSQDEKIKLKVVPLINQALKKRPKNPLVLFVDLNLSMDDAKRIFQAQEIIELLDRVKKLDNGNDIFNLIVFTNHPYHYAPDSEPYPPKSYSFVFSQSPEIKTVYPKSLQDISTAVSMYGQIPNEFPKKDELIF